MSIADRINSISSNLSSAYGRIAYLGVDTSSIDKNIQNLSTVLDTVYNDYPKVSDEGISPSLEGSKVGRLSTVLKASDTTQDGEPTPDYPQDIHGVKGNNIVEVCGKNLCSTTMDVTLTSGSEKWKQVELTYENSNIVWENGATYYIRVFMEQQSNEVAQIKNYGYARCDDAVKTITFSGTIPQIRVGANTLNGNITNEEVKIMVAKVSFDNYEPYTGATYPINLPVQNLFDKDNANLLNNTFIGSTSLGISTGAKTLYIPCLPSTTYTISRIAGQRFTVGDTNTTPASSVSVSNRTADSTGTSITTTTSADAKYLVVYYYLSSADTLTEQQIRDTIQIELGNKVNRYTPYGVAPIELCKINTYQDKLFKAISGDTVYDSLTAEQKEGLVSGGWYKYGEIGKVVLNGSESWDGGSSATTSTDYTYMHSAVLDGLIKLRYYKAFCDKFYVRENIMGIGTSVDTDTIAVGDPMARKVRIMILTSRLATQSVIGFKTWLSNNNVTVYYVLATATITQITDTTLISQLETLYKAQSKNGQTNILQTNADLPFIISASALKAS